MDAIGPETDFTPETNRKGWKKNYWRILVTPEFHFVDLEFLTITKSEMKSEEWKHVFYIVPQFWSMFWEYRIILEKKWFLKKPCTGCPKKNGAQRFLSSKDCCVSMFLGTEPFGHHRHLHFTWKERSLPVIINIVIIVIVTVIASIIIIIIIIIFVRSDEKISKGSIPKKKWKFMK